VSDLVNIKKYLFGGFRKCLYEIQKFDVDSERRFAVILEDDNAVLKWFKTARGQFQIYYHKDQAYESDFLWNCGPLVKRMRIVLVKQILWRTALVDWRQRRWWPRARRVVRQKIFRSVIVLNFISGTKQPGEIALVWLVAKVR
jgi:hypothetical protein